MNSQNDGSAGIACRPIADLKTERDGDMTQETDLADFLRVATDDELFHKMRELEAKSEKEGLEEVEALVELTATAIENRFPGQSLAPYVRWKQDRLL